MTSCCVVSSISATRSGVGGGALRTGSTTSAGTPPAAACASSTSGSTPHHNSYLCWSLQTPPISGRVYRSIMLGPLRTDRVVAPRPHLPAPPGKLRIGPAPDRLEDRDVPTGDPPRHAGPGAHPGGGAGPARLAGHPGPPGHGRR